MGFGIGYWVVVAMMIMQGVCCYNYDGCQCAESKELVMLDGDRTYADVTTKMRNLWISQIILYMAYFIWVGHLSKSIKGGMAE